MTQPHKFIDELLVVNTSLGRSMTQLANAAGVCPNVVFRAQSGSVPRKISARALTAATLKQLNAEIRKRAEEIERLQRYGENLRRAYLDNYEGGHKNAEL